MEYENLKRIWHEVMQGREPAVPDTPEQAVTRAQMKAELAALPPGAYLDWPSEIEA